MRRNKPKNIGTLHKAARRMYCSDVMGVMVSWGLWGQDVFQLVVGGHGDQGQQLSCENRPSRMCCIGT